MIAIREKIVASLADIESEEGVRIVYACESGSRAWGFPSTDSDYDVRFIYVRPLEWYLTIRERRDVIEQPISDMLDINGWDLRKALQLLRKSNPPLLEWLQSPIVYRESGEMPARLRSLAKSRFSPKSCIYHYLHMARGNYREYLQGERVKIKKYFYVLRPILACRWIESFDSIPPLDFEQLVDQLLPEDGALTSAVRELLVRKRAGEELDYEPRIAAINTFIEDSLTYYEQYAAGLAASAPVDDQTLDAFFRQAVLG